MILHLHVKILHLYTENRPPSCLSSATLATVAVESLHTKGGSPWHHLHHKTDWGLTTARHWDQQVDSWAIFRTKNLKKGLGSMKHINHGLFIWTSTSWKDLEPFTGPFSYRSTESECVSRNGKGWPFIKPRLPWVMEASSCPKDIARNWWSQWLFRAHVGKLSWAAVARSPSLPG